MIVVAARNLARIVLLVTGVMLIVFALLTLVARLVLPLAADYKSDLEGKLGEYLDRPVTIGKLDLAWSSNGPELRLEDVSVIESVTQSVRFRELLVDVDLFGSLLSRKPVVDELTLVGADLAIDYTGEGRFALHGAEEDVEQGSAGADKAARREPRDTDSSGGLDVIGWLLNVGEVGLLDTRLTIDDAGSGQSLVIDSINVRAESAGSLHRLRLELELPPSLGDSFEAGIDLVGTSENLAATGGDFYVKGTNLHLHGWKSLRAGMLSRMVEKPDDALRTALAQAFDTAEADADVELWGTWQDSEIVSARARVDVNGLVIDASPGVDPEDHRNVLLDRLQADMSYRDDQPGWTVQADRIVLNGGDDEAVIENVEFGRGARSAPKWRVSAGGERLPLTLFGRLPNALSALLTQADAAADGGDASAVESSEVIDESAGSGADAIGAAGAQAVRTLSALSPQGSLLDWQLDLADLEGDPRLSVEADLDQIGLASIGRAPGVEGIDGKLRIRDNRGTIAFVGNNAALTRDDDRLAIDALELVVDVDGRIPGQLRADGRLSIARESLDMNSRFGLTSGAEHSPRIDLQGRYTIGDVSDVPDWLPFLGTPAGLTAWFEQALQGGRADNGTIIWFGRLADFPHENGEGTLQSRFELSDGKLAFLSDWPAADLPTGTVELNGFGIVARSTDARLTSFQATRLEARINDLRRPALSFEASGRDDLSAILDFGREGPLASLLGATLSDVSGTGEAGLDLALDVPLSGAARRVAGGAASATGRRAAGAGLTLDGSVFLDGNDVRFGRADLTLADARGAIGFNETGIRIGSMKAALFDRPITLKGASRGEGDDAETTISLGGVLAASDVLAHYEIPLDRFVSGASRWNVTLNAPHGRERFAAEGVRILATSDLVGTEVLLPLPLSKSSALESSFRIETAFREGSDDTRWHIAQDDDLDIAVDVDADGLRALGARLGGGMAEVPSADGFAFSGHAYAIAFDGWATAVSELLDDLPVSEGEPVPIPAIYANLTTEALVAGVQSLGKASFKATTDDNYINAVVDNERINGSIRYPRTHWRREVPALLRIGHVDKSLIDALSSAPETGEPVTAIDPREIPAIEVHVSSLRWDALALNDINMTIGATDTGISFVSQTLSRGDTSLDARGFWSVSDAADVDASRPDMHQSEIALTLAGRDLGAGLSAVGYPAVLAEGEGEANATFGWKGPLYSPEIPLMSGSGDFDIARGSIVPVDPGAAKLVGLFALQSIPRRLNFDFRDVTSDGLAFERVNGAIGLDSGVVNVELVQLNGPVGVIDVTGTSNLITRQYDQKITVLPRVSAALPIIGLISAGATGGIGAIVAGGVLKAIGLDVDRIGLRRFALRGSWDDPEFGPSSSSRRTGRE